MFGPILPRAEAKRIGHKRYFTCNPCRRGHVDVRIVSSLICLTCSRINLAASRARNPERTLANDRACKDRNREKFREAERSRYWSDPDKCRAKARRKYAKNSDEIRRKRKIAYAAESLNPKYRAAAVSRAKDWVAKNPEKAYAHRRNQKARRKLSPGTHTGRDIKEILKMQGSKCAYCRVGLKSKYHVDHIQPLALGGSNDRSNLQILCKPCNLTKGARDPIDHARRIGLLL